MPSTHGGGSEKSQQNTLDMFIAGILLDKGLDYIEVMRQALLGITSIFTLAGFVEGAWLAGENMKEQLFNLLKVVFIAALAFNFPVIIQAGDKAFLEVHTSISEKQGALDQSNQDAFLQQIKAQATEPSWMDVAGRLTYSIGTCLQNIGFIGYQIVYWIKDVSMLLLIAISPLLIGCLAFSYTKSIGVNFLITSFTIILWNIGFAIVDTLLIILGNIIMPIMGAGVAGVASSAVVTVGPQFLVMCLVAAVLPIALYFSVPIITGAIMRGSNVAGAAMSAFGMAQQAVYYSGISKLVSAAATSLNSAASPSQFSSFPSPSPQASGPFMETGGANQSFVSPSPGSQTMLPNDSQSTQGPNQEVTTSEDKAEKIPNPQLQLKI